jgi:hypothetical protein
VKIFGFRPIDPTAAFAPGWHPKIFPSIEAPGK